MSQSPYVPIFVCPSFRKSQSTYVPVSVCPNLHMFQSPYIPISTAPCPNFTNSQSPSTTNPQFQTQQLSNLATAALSNSQLYPLPTLPTPDFTHPPTLYTPDFTHSRLYQFPTLPTPDFINSQIFDLPTPISPIPYVTNSPCSFDSIAHVYVFRCPLSDIPYRHLPMFLGFHGSMISLFLVSRLLQLASGLVFHISLHISAFHITLLIIFDENFTLRENPHSNALK